MKTILVSGAAIIHEGELVVGLKRKYNHLEFFGGKVDPGETLEEAVHREVKEEIRSHINIIEKNYLIHRFLHNGKQYENHIHLTEFSGKQYPQIAENEFFEKIVFMKPNEYLEYPCCESVQLFCEKYTTSSYRQFS